MSKSITPAQIEQVKVAAKRLKKSCPDLPHAKLLDISAYQFFGVASYHEAQKRADFDVPVDVEADVQEDEAEEVASNLRDQPSSADPLRPRRTHYSEYTDLKPAVTVGHWHYFSETMELCFDGAVNPYVLTLDQVSSTGKYLDWILQLNRKFWPKIDVERYGVWPDYQVKEFIRMMDWLCQAYFKDTVQGVFSPSGKVKTVDWKAAIKKRGPTALEPFPSDYYEQ